MRLRDTPGPVMHSQPPGHAMVAGPERWGSDTHQTWIQVPSGSRKHCQNPKEKPFPREQRAGWQVRHRARGGWRASWWWIRPARWVLDLLQPRHQPGRRRRSVSRGCCPMSQCRQPARGPHPREAFFPSSPPTLSSCSDRGPRIWRLGKAGPGRTGSYREVEGSSGGND